MAAATRQKQASIPALIPTPNIKHRQFWAVVALNNDADVQALRALHSAESRRAPSASNHTKRMALVRAMIDAERDAAKAFTEARNDAVLLYAWRGSKALVQSLPASLNGGAA